MILDPASAWVQPTLLITGVVLVLEVLTGKYRIFRLLLSIVGFFVGLWTLILALLAGARGLIDISTFAVMLVSGAALFSRPTKNIRWAALLGLAAGLAATYYFNMIIGHAVPFALLLVFLASSLVVYLLFKFAEDLLDLSRAVLEIRIVSLAIGVICIVWGLK